MTTEITVEGMTCGGCEQNVENALESVEGVTDAKANRETEQATVEGEAETDDLVSAVEKAGYTAKA